MRAGSHGKPELGMHACLRFMPCPVLHALCLPLGAMLPTLFHVLSLVVASRLLARHRSRSRWQRTLTARWACCRAWASGWMARS